MKNHIMFKCFFKVQILLLIFALATVGFSQKPKFKWLKGGTVLGVNSINYSPDGKMLATAGDDGTIKFWVANSGMLIRTIKASQNYYVICVKFSPDGSMLASSADDKLIRIWDVETGTLIRSWTADPYQIYALDFSPDGHQIASGGTDAKIKIWEVQTGTLIKTLNGHTDYVYDIEYSNDGANLISVSDDQTLKKWNITTGTQIWSVVAHDWYAIDADFSHSEQYIATTGGLNQPQLKIWNASTGAHIRTINADPFSINQCEWAIDDQTIITSGRYGLKVWNIATGALLRHEENGDMAMALSPDGKIVTHAGAAQAPIPMAYDTVYQRKYEDLSLIRELTAHTSSVMSLAYSPKNKVLASGCNWFESAVKLRDISNGNNLLTMYYTIANEGIRDIRFSEDETTLLVGGGKGYARLFRISDGTVLQDYNHGGTGPLTVYSVAFHPYYDWVLTGGSDGFIKVWFKSTGSLMDIWAPGNYPYTMDFSPQDNLLAVGTNSGVTLLNSDSGAVVRYISGHTKKVNKVKFTSDGNFVVTASDDGTCGLWNVYTGELVRSFAGHVGFVRSLDLAPSNKRLITCGEDETVRIWDVQTGAQIAIYDVETGKDIGGVQSVIFCNNDNQFAIGRRDGTVGMTIIDKSINTISIVPENRKKG